MHEPVRGSTLAMVLAAAVCTVTVGASGSAHPTPGIVEPIEGARKMPTSASMASGYWIRSFVPLPFSGRSVATAAGPASSWPGVPRDAPSPADYVIAKLATHRIVILGEGHRTKHEVQLVLDLLPRLPGAGVDTIALETFGAAEQPLIDRLLASPEWDAPAAMKVLRLAVEMPYREYFEILHEAWKLNRAEGRFHVLALGPGRSWREELIPRGRTYDSFMADLVAQHLEAAKGRRILVHAGAHHGFTRHVLSDMPEGPIVTRFSDRMGNILWRRFGEAVFFVYMHRPWHCRAGKEFVRCLPLGGAIDCAGARLGRPFAFDTAPSPFGEMLLQPDSWYALGYAKHRLLDFADGYIWFRLLDQYESATIIALSEFAPDDESLAFVREHNFITDEKGLSTERLSSLWREETERSKEFMKANGWEGLRDWRRLCEAGKTSSGRLLHR